MYTNLLYLYTFIIILSMYTAVDRKVGFIKVKLNKNLKTIVRAFLGSFTLHYFRVRAGFELDLVGPLTTLG